MTAKSWAAEAVILGIAGLLVLWLFASCARDARREREEGRER